jgi:hypothetical protein
MMNQYDFEELSGYDFADDVLRAIEKDHGRSIVKIPKFKRIGKTRFLISIIFSDFTLLEAEIEIKDRSGLATIDIYGVYY